MHDDFFFFLLWDINEKSQIKWCYILPPHWKNSFNQDVHDWAKKSKKQIQMEQGPRKAQK